MVLRSTLTPFLKTASKALSIELENQDVEYSEKESLLKELLENVPAESSNSNLYVTGSQNSETLVLEFDRLLNLK